MPPRLPNRPACCRTCWPAPTCSSTARVPGTSRYMTSTCTNASSPAGRWAWASPMDGASGTATRLTSCSPAFLRADLGSAAMGIARVKLIAEHLRHKLFNLQSKSRAFEVGEQHYDAGNDVFEAMLDSRMIYSCAYWGERRDAGRSPVRQARHDLPQAAPQARRDVAGHRLRLGRAGQVRRRELRRESHRRDRVQGTAGAAQQRVRACRWNCCCRTTATCRAASTRSCRWACSSTGPKNYDTTSPTCSGWAPKASSCCTPSASPPPARAPIPGSTAMCSPTAAALGGGDLHRRRRPLHHRGLAQLRRRLRSHADGLVGPVPARLAAVGGRYGKRFYRMWQYYLMCCAGFFRSREGQLWQVI